MQELRFVAVSEDGSYAVLAVPGRSGRYVLPIDERLRAVAQGQTSRLAQYEIEVESPLRPKEIQARIRAGETAEEIADAAGIPVERVRWFEGPVLAERGYIADQAQAGSVRRAGDSAGPGPRLGDIVTARLSASGTDPADGQWDSRKRGDGNWQVSLTFPSGGRLHVAEWVFDPRRRHVMPDDDNAARLSLPESELPPEPVSVPGEATVTPIASRLGAAAGMGGGYAGGPAVAGAPGGSRFRPERSVIPDRSLGADRSLADRPHADRPHADRAYSDRAYNDRTTVERPQADRVAPPPAPAAERPALPERPAASDRPAAPDRAGYQTHTGPRDYVEFPESAPYRIPDNRAAEYPAAGAGYRDQAAEPAPGRAPGGQSPAYRDHEPGPAGYRTGEPAYRPYEAEQGGYHQPAPEPAAYRGPAAPAAPPAPPRQPAAETAPASSGPAFADEERMPVTAPRPVVFEEPEPAFRGEHLGVASDLAPAPVAAEPVAPAAPAPAAPAPEAPAAPAPVVAETPAPVAAATLTAQPEVTLAGPAVPAREAAPVAPAASAVQGAAPVTPAAPAVTPAPAVAPAAAPVTPAASVAPAAAAGQVAVAGQAAPAEQLTAPAERPAATAELATAAASVTDEAGRATAEPASAVPVPAATAAPEPQEAEVSAPVTQEPARITAPAASTATPAVPAPAEPPATEDQGTRPRPGAKKNAKARRSSVPSWDEIMLGSTRPRD